MKYIRRTLFSTLLVAGGLSYGYYFVSKTLTIPKEIKPHFLSSLVLQDKTIHLPSLKGSFLSPSIISRPEGYLLSSILKKKERYAVKNWKSREKIEKYYITFTSLGEAFDAKGESQLIQLKDHAGIPLFNLVQANLISCKGMNWLLYIDQPIPNRFNSYAVAIHEYENKFILSPPKLIRCHEFSDAGARWTPIVLDNTLFLFSNAETISCVELDPQSGKCTPVPGMEMNELWNFGHISSFCPTIKTTEGMLGFFHSTLESPYFMDRAKRSPINLMGAWSPSLIDSFHIQALTEKPITTKRLYSHLNNQKKLVEPTGITEKDDYVIVSSLVGKTDIHVMKIKTKDLFAHMNEHGPSSKNQDA